MYLPGPQLTISQCFCGDGDTEHDRLGSSKNCIYPCAGTDGEICGGSNAIQVRNTATSASAAPSQAQRVDCSPDRCDLVPPKHSLFRRSTSTQCQMPGSYGYMGEYITCDERQGKGCEFRRGQRCRTLRAEHVLYNSDVRCVIIF